MRPGSATPSANARPLARAFALGTVGLGLNLAAWFAMAGVPARGDTLDLHAMADLGVKVFGTATLVAGARSITKGRLHISICTRKPGSPGARHPRGDVASPCK